MKAGVNKRKSLFVLPYGSSYLSLVKDVKGSTKLLCKIHHVTLADYKMVELIDFFLAQHRVPSSGNFLVLLAQRRVSVNEL
jgi:hypothetical protein